MVCTLFGVPIFLAAGTTAQYAQFGFGGAYPTGNGYGQMAGYMGGGFGGYMGGGLMGGYGGQYGRQCRSNVRSEDLQGGFQQCYCDKNHRDEDPCGNGKSCDGNWDKDYYKDIFDEDCVQQWQKPTNVRRCQAKTKSKDLAGPAVCWCDSNHKKDADDMEAAEQACIDDNAGSEETYAYYSDYVIAVHYGTKGSAYASYFNDDCLGNPCSSSLEQEVRDAFDAFDPNCVERFGGYGGYGGYGAYGGFGQQYGGYGGFGMGYNAGYGQQFGGNMFYPTSMMQPTAAAPVDGAAPAPAATTWQFQPQQYGGYRGYGGYGGYRGYYGR